MEGEVKVGESIKFFGHTTDFTLVIDSMEVNNAKVEKAVAGDYIGIQVPDRVRPGDEVFKEHNPANPLQRADAFRFLTQNLGQAFDLALETRDTRYPMLHAFCTPTRKLGGDAADFTYRQAWIDGRHVYRISGNTGNEAGGGSQTQGGATVLTISSGQDTLTGLDFTLGTGGEIHGRVTDAASGAGVANVGVWANEYDSGSFGYGTNTDASGYYTVTGLPDADYRVEVSDPNTLPAEYAWQYYNQTIDWGAAERVTVAGGILSWVTLAKTPETVAARQKQQSFGREVLGNRPAMLLITAYTIHCWELLGMWAWTPAFMAACLVWRGAEAVSAAGLGAYVSAGFHLAGLVASFSMGALSDRVGRARVIMVLASISTLCSLCFGWTIELPFLLILVIGATLQSELAPLEDRSRMRVSATGPEGATFEYMDDYMKGLGSEIERGVPGDAHHGLIGAVHVKAAHAELH